MNQPALSAVDVHALHQQARGIMHGIQTLAGDLASSPEFDQDESVIRGLDELQLDLSRLKVALDRLKGFEDVKIQKSSTEANLPSLLGGMALGVVLGKFWGSKLQLDLLPFLVGLDMVTGTPQKKFWFQAED